MWQNCRPILRNRITHSEQITRGQADGYDGSLPTRYRSDTSTGWASGAGVRGFLAERTACVDLLGKLQDSKARVDCFDHIQEASSKIAVVPRRVIDALFPGAEIEERRSDHEGSNHRLRMAPEDASRLKAEAPFRGLPRSQLPKVSRGRSQGGTSDRCRWLQRGRSASRQSVRRGLSRPP